MYISRDSKTNNPVLPWGAGPMGVGADKGLATKRSNITLFEAAQKGYAVKRDRIYDNKYATYAVKRDVRHVYPVYPGRDIIRLPPKVKAFTLPDIPKMFGERTTVEKIMIGAGIVLAVVGAVALATHKKVEEP